jgi:hypothetical protein
MRLVVANPTSFTQKMDLLVTELKVTGVINKNTISRILNFYPNDLLNSKIVAFTDQKQVVYCANEIPSGAFNKKTKPPKMTEWNPFADIK